MLPGSLTSEALAVYRNGQAAELDSLIGPWIRGHPD